MLWPSARFDASGEKEDKDYCEKGAGPIITENIYSVIDILFFIFYNGPHDEKRGLSRFDFHN
jgi:hypothetical protein